MNLPKTYEPNQYEADIYALWEKSGAFSPHGKGDPFTIIMPPPNANASLHAGHSLTYAVQDIVARYQRMKGRATLYVPGADHAGFETQVVYEKHLAKEGKSRFDFSREELYSQIYDFVQKNKGGFEQQLRALGISCDWQHFTFTLDAQVVKTAHNSFKKMWDDGLIYRGKRLVNFCTFHGTAFADIEVDHKEETGKLWYIRYPLTIGDGEVVVATTRPETMLGDTGVAVHPEDGRYVAFAGKTVRLPLTGREVPIVADTFVDPKFGTGAVKLTPAHDPNDYEAAERHSLPKISIITHEGKISAEAPEQYRGLTVKEAREAVVQDLDEQGFLVKTEDITHSVGHCYKCGTVIEPMLMDQWFVDMQPLAKEAIKVLKADKITFYPASKQAEVIRYLENVRDWNISRQIAWGIPIPAFQNVDDPEDWIYDDRVDQEIITIEDPSTGSGQVKTYHRDPDVFDTWFSSGQWPYATLGFPDSDDFKRFYPTELMETGVDILFQWVSRMICLGLYIAGDIPFKTVYLHGMVRSEDGRKMSKSLGNVIPLEDTVANYGADALRGGIISGRSAGFSAAYAPSKIEAARNFCNKLWNIARYTESVLGKGYKPGTDAKAVTKADHWVLSKLHQSTEIIGSLLDEYRFSEAYEQLYHFVWDDVADWYIEASKAQTGESGREVLGYVLENVLKLAHPFAPFVTETIWQTLYANTDSLLISSRWPEPVKADAKQAAEFSELQTIVTEARGLVKSLGLSKPHLYYTDVPFLAENEDALARLSGLGGVSEVSDGTGLYLTSTPYRCWLEVDTETIQAYTEKLKAQLAEQTKVNTQLEGRLSNKPYVENAPKQIVEQTREQLALGQANFSRLQAEYDRFTAA